VSAVVVGVFAATVTDTVKVGSETVGGADLQTLGRQALERIAKDLSRTGHVASPLGVDLPHVFENGIPDPTLEDGFLHDVQEIQARVATFPLAPLPTGGTTPLPFVAPGQQLQPIGIREVVFALPEDLDGDGRPLNEITGAIEWGADLVGFILVPEQEGTMDLVRRTWLQTGEIRDVVICRRVDAMTIDTTVSKQTLPRDAVEIHLHLLRRRPDGLERRMHVFTTVYMRNSL
jgi:hypothetical protein